MADRIQKVTNEVEPSTTPTGRQREVTHTSETSVGGPTLLARIVWFVAGVILILLAFRFVLTLLGANQSNGFANFIYSASHPFVAPFFGLFGYDGLRYGVSRFEIYTLIAIAVYAIIAWGLAKLVTINKPQPE